MISGYNGTAHTANLAVTGITSGTGPGTIVPGEILTGPSFTGYAVVRWTIQRPERNLRHQHDEQQHHGKPGRGDDDFGTDGRIVAHAITTPPLGWSTGVSTPEGVGAIQTNDADNNLTGTELYDNSGVSGNPLAGKFGLPNGGLEFAGAAGPSVWDAARGWR